MNKKFFAKYLPVEGEVHEGDKYLDRLVPWVKKPLTHSGMVYYGDELNGTYRNPIIQAVEGTTSPKNCIRKVKLFLCTRDIQIGDQVYWEYPKGITPACLTVVAIPEITSGLAGLDDKYLLTCPSEISAFSLDIYKPIGEIIASRSLHIEDGDEFNTDEARKLIAIEL